MRATHARWQARVRGGELKRPEKKRMNTAAFTTVNPSTGEQIETFSYFAPAQIEKVVAQADKSFQSFRKLSVHKRAQLLTELGNSLRKNKAQLAKIISTEMGKIFSEAEAEIEKCAREADWYSEHGPKIMADEPAPTGRVNAYVSLMFGPSFSMPPGPRFSSGLSRQQASRAARARDERLRAFPPGGS